MRLFIFSFILSVSLFFVGSVFAFQTPVELVGEEKSKKISTVEAYLNALGTFAADFEQSVGGRASSTGVFFLKKPGRFLWHYQKPEPSKLVSSGGTIYFHDETTNQATQIPRKGVANLLTKKVLDLTDDDFNVEHVYDNNGLLHIILNFKGLSQGDVGAQVELSFLQNPMQLRQITTTNQLGQQVEVFLYNIKENQPISNQVFKFVPFHYQEK